MCLLSLYSESSCRRVFRMLIFVVFVAFGCAALVVFGVVPAKVTAKVGKRPTEHVRRSDTFTPGASIGSCTSHGIGRNR